MLSLELPSFEITGLTVFRDHAVPTQFYYAAPPPSVARTGGRLMFDVLAYTVELEHSVLSGTSIPDELGAGFLTMGTECVLSAAQRSNLTRELESRTGLPEEGLSLSPIPYHAGSVSVLALDRFSAPAEPAADTGSATPTKGRPTFVEQILGSGKPALLGDLRTIFSLSLSQEGVAFLEGLYRERAAPVGVVYDLKFYGLRPSVEAIVHANLSRVFEHFGGSLGAQYAWARAEIKAGIDRLQERGDIRIELTSQATGEEAQKSKDLALSLFRDRIVQEMFRPTAQMPTTVPALGVPAGTGAAAAAANTPSVNLTLELKRTYEDKVVHYSFQERAPEERTHAPQGFLNVLLGRREVEQHLHHISLDNAFFELLEVLVTGPTKEELDTLGIRQIEATLRYGEGEAGTPPEEETLVFRPDSTGDKTFAVKRRGRKSLAYTCALTYEFARTPGSDSDAFRYELPAQSRTGRALRLNPYADFGVLEVEVEPGRLHPDVRELDVHLTYDDGHFAADEHFRLMLGTEGTAPHRWQVRTRETDLRPYTVQNTFIFADGATYTALPQSFTDPLLRVDSPFAAERTLLIKPVPISDQITAITVELDYEDAVGGYRRTRLVELAPPFASVKQVWPILAADRQTVRYRVTVHEPGLLSEGEWEETDEPSLIVGSEAHRVGRVDVRLIGPPLGEVGLDALQIKVALALPGVPPEEPKSVLLQPGEAQASVDLTLPPGTTLRYRYQTLAFKSDGTTKESAWKEMTSSPLILSTRTL